MIKKIFSICFILLLPITIIGNSKIKQNKEKNRWTIQDDGSIKWVIDERVPHYDHLEMSGEQVSAVLRYGVNSDNSFRIERTVIWPMLRTIPNNTHGSMTKRFANDFISNIVVNGQSLKYENVESIIFDGLLSVTSHFHLSYNKSHNSAPVVEVVRKFFPSVNNPALCEMYSVKNLADRPIEIMIPALNAIYNTDKENSVNGSYTIALKLQKTGTFIVQPGSQIDFQASIQAFSTEKKEKELILDIDQEYRNRKHFISKMWNSLVLETPDDVIDKSFAFAKIRASESIYRTEGGLMHGPGGEAYYAAIWANDESEYVAPFFPLLGYNTANEATLNAYRLYMKYMNDTYKPVPSSIIAEGKDIWHGAGDCGDAAMLAYGGIRYALIRGDKNEAQYIWPLMEWCLEYCNRRLNDEGVVQSDSDELEGRFPSGNANLLVSSLYYDALVSAQYLAKELALPTKQMSKYKNQAKQLKKSIESYFGSEVEGYETYSYYKGNTKLRAWICAPLFAGIHNRGKTTINALFSNLWTKDGLLSETGSESFWDRSTLSALRAGFVTGETDSMINYLNELSNRRLLGEHVPYPIEAWPEGNQRHLSGESALYCRIITEGLFGIRPTGFNSFTITPRLPKNWDKMTLKNIRGFGSDFDINVTRKGKMLNVIVKTKTNIISDTNIKDGESLHVDIFESKNSKNLSNQKELSFLFKSGEDGYNTYRIPAMTVTNKGSILAFAEGRKNNSSDTGDIDVVLKRSTDNGKTWSLTQVIWDNGENTCGNPAPVVDRETGTIFLLLTGNLEIDHEHQIINQTSKDTRRVFVSQSTDDGVTWTTPKEITQNVKKDHWTWYATGPCQGIQISNGPHKGRLVIPCNHVEAATSEYHSHIIYSDDHGKNWQLGGSTSGETVNECTVAEISNGKLLLNMRNFNSTNSFRKTSISEDGGITWSSLKSDETLIEPVCQASMHKYSTGKKESSKLLFLNPANSEDRCNLTLRLSFDEGINWHKSFTVYQGPSAYSDIFKLSNGNIGCLYEAGLVSPYEGIIFEQINLKEL